MELPRSYITITIASAVKNVPAMKKNGNTVLDTGTTRRKMVGAIHSSRRRDSMELFIKIMLIVILVSFAILSLSGCAAGLVALVRWIGGIV